MKSFLILALVAVAAADVAHLVRSPEADAVVEQQEADVLPDQFNYVYKTSNGIAGQESGVLKNVGQENAALEVTGSNSYIAPDGQKVETTWVANENGYQPQGSHLPTPPPPQPIPDYILRAIEYIRTHAPVTDKYPGRV